MAVMKGILGRKLGMTQVFDDEGRAVAATLVEAGPCVVVQRKTAQRDGYDAVQLGFGAIRPKHVNQPMKGHFARAAREAAAHKDKDSEQKAAVEPCKVLVEFRLAESAGAEALEVGSQVTVDGFEVGERVNVAGTTKGKGFAGVVRRYGARGGGATHGSMFHRRPASAGATDAARVFKGTRRPGHYGAVRFTAKGLCVLEVHPEQHLMVIRGAVPGASGGLLRITVPVRRPRRQAKVKVIS
jgi:large subunit ribosomal protein L3